MTIPVKVFGDYVVCFDAEPEHIGMRQHFIKECGWTPSQYKRIQDFAWFSARVSIWLGGVELACDYLGACCYEFEQEFYTTFECDYFCDMVHECAEEIGDVRLLQSVNSWRNKFREAVAQ